MNAINFLLVQDVLFSASVAAVPFLWRKRISNYAAFVWAYFILHTVWYQYFPPSRVYLSSMPVQVEHLSIGNWEALVKLVVMPSIALSLSLRQVTFVFRACIGILLVNSALIFFGFRGIFLGQTMDGAALALFVPIAWLYGGGFRHYFSFVFIATSIYTMSRTAAMVFVAQLASRKLTLVIAACFLAIAAVFFYPEILKTRMFIWAPHLDWWLANSSVLFGEGSGSYYYLGSFMPTLFHSGRSFVLMHNDYLQLLFEVGVIGVLLVGGMICNVVKTNRFDAIHFSLSLGFLAAMLTYYPAHFFITQILGLYLLRVGLDDKFRAEVKRIN